MPPGAAMLRPYGRSRSEQALEGAAREAEQVVNDKRREHDERGDNDGCGDGMGRGHPSEPYGQEVFTKTQDPIAERFGTGVDGGAGAGFCAVRGEGDSTSEQGGPPAPLGSGATSGGESEESGGRRTYEGVDGVPYRIEVRNFVRKKLQQIKTDGDSENPGMGEALQARRQVEDAEALEKAESRDGGVEIEAGRESGAEREAESFDRIHSGPS